MTRADTFRAATATLIALFVLARPVRADDCVRPFYDPSKPNQASFTGHLFSVGTGSPAAKELQSSSDLKAKVKPTYDLFNVLSKHIENRRKNKASDACNLAFDTSWIGSSRMRASIHAIGELPEDCHSMLDVGTAESEGLVDAGTTASANNIIRDGRLGLYDALQKSFRSMPLTNWTATRYPLVDWQRRRSRQECSVNAIFGYRMPENGWHLAAAMTNYELDSFAAEYERNLIEEYVPFASNQSIEMCLPRFDEDSPQEEGPNELGTVAMARWGGRQTFGSVQGDSIDDDPSAINTAYRSNLVSIDLAADAITVSNVAILALPMAMSLIPLAFVAELNSLGMLIYILITDVFSTIPFIVKGYELVRSSAPSKEVVQAFFTGNETLAVMELWSAECRGEESFRIIGILFICIGLFLTITGLALEYLATVAMRKRRELEEHARGPFGAVVMESTTLGLLGKEETELEDEYRKQADLLMEEDPLQTYAFRFPGAARQRSWWSPTRRREEAPLEVEAESSEIGANGRFY